MSRIDDLVKTLCPNGVEFVAVGTVAVVGTGSNDRKDASASGAFPFYVRSREILQIDHFEFDEDAIVIPGEGGVGEIFHFVSGKYALHQRAYRIHFQDDRIDPKFAYHYFKNNFKRFILKRAVSATVTSIRKPMITNFRLPVPPLAVQHEIVKILDTFESLEAELEAELEARRRQYEHYRDELLTFPDGVEFRTLGEIGEFLRGSGIQKGDLTAEGLGAIHYGEIHTYYGSWAVQTKSFIPTAMAVRARKARTGDLVIATTSEDDEAVGKAVAWLGPTEVAVSTDAFIFRHTLDPKFVSYFFQSDQFHRQKQRHITGAKVRRISGASLSKIRIPVPPVEVQRETARVLDKFDALVNDISIGLPAEIAARRKQYEYYRNRLLTFEEAK